MPPADQLGAEMGRGAPFPRRRPAIRRATGQHTQRGHTYILAHHLPARASTYMARFSRRRQAKYFGAIYLMQRTYFSPTTSAYRTMWQPHGEQLSSTKRRFHFFFAPKLYFASVVATYNGHELRA